MGGVRYWALPYPDRAAMTRLRSMFRVSAAAWLLAAAGATLAADSAAPAPVTDEMLAPLTSAYLRAVKPGEPADRHRDLFATVLDRVQRNYARETDMPGLIAAALKVLEPLEPQSGEPAEVFGKAINQALATLDPYSRYVDARSLGNERGMASGSFGGVGLEVEMSDGLVRVAAAMPGTPAARAGLRGGDFIVRVDEQPVLGMALADAISRMRGEPGTAVVVTIRRAGLDNEFAVSLTRDVIRTQALRWSMKGDVLVLRLARFTGSVTAALQRAIAEATAAHASRAVVLDLRGNGGGLLREAVMTADAFLSKGGIVALQGRTQGNLRHWQADGAEHLAGLPMVVLIDARSASASELVAAALQENGRAIVMGQRSFGKGSVQSNFWLGEGKGALKLTTALYYGPSGRTVQRTGVGPDIELLTPESAERAARREAVRAQALPGTDEPAPPKARVEQARCARLHKDSDPALACALAYLHAAGIEAFLGELGPAAEAPR
jgi:carboxyl-terminal processing protease